MSGSGHACECPERAKPIGERAWIITKWMCNYSAVGGGIYQPSQFSEVHCPRCQAYWRTRMAYINKLRRWNGDLDEL